MTTAHDLLWSPQPGPQTALVTCPVEDILYGGARGGGKTDGFLGKWLQRSTRCGGKTKGLFVRRSMPELDEVIARSHEIYLPIGAQYRTQKSTWIMPNGALLRLRSLERDADAGKYQGHPYTDAYIDEAGNFPPPAPSTSFSSLSAIPMAFLPALIYPPTPTGQSMDSQFQQFLRNLFISAFTVTKEGGPFYVVHADTEGVNFRLALQEAGFYLKQVLIRVKSSSVMGRQDYHWQHEPILYGWKPGAAHVWYGERNKKTVIDQEPKTRELDKHSLVTGIKELRNRTVRHGNPRG